MVQQFFFYEKVNVLNGRYLYEFLYGWLVSALTRADSFIVGQDVLEPKNRPNKKSRTKKKKPKPYKYRREIVYYQALQNMCGGFYKASFFLIIKYNNYLTNSKLEYFFAGVVRFSLRR